MLKPCADIENRFMYLCNDFDDLISFMSFAALGLVPPPTFCKKKGIEGFRSHLSLCGVVVGDVVDTSNPRPPGPVPSIIPASRPDLISWAELGFRAYMFGAIRNGRDTFTDAFVKQLRLYPDKFVVILRSETDTGQWLESFGGGQDETFYQMRCRMFEAPMASFSDRPVGSGAWNNIRMGRDVLYGTGQGGETDMKGYLRELETQRNEGWLFWLKKDRFKVKYFLILDAQPNRSGMQLIQNVAWAAMCAAGYVRGAYSMKQYVKATDALLQATITERLSWLPPSVCTVNAPSAEERFKQEGLDQFADIYDSMR